MMTVAEALIEAKRRWGDEAWVQFLPPVDLGCGIGCTVGVKVNGHMVVKGSGTSFEAAFEDCDKADTSEVKAALNRLSSAAGTHNSLLSKEEIKPMTVGKLIELLADFDKDDTIYADGLKGDLVVIGGKTGICRGWVKNSGCVQRHDRGYDLKPENMASEMRVCEFPECNEAARTNSSHCEKHKNEPNDCACRAGAPFHTDERCPGFRRT
jgi:hypothetical protein